MFPVTITINNAVDLRKVLGVLESTSDTPLPTIEQPAEKVPTKKSAPGATPARSQPTATAETAHVAQEQNTGKQAPQSATAATATASSAGDAVDYPSLAKAVGELLKLVSPTEATAVVKEMTNGEAQTFKQLKPEQYAEAKRLVEAKVAEIKADKQGGVV